MNGAKVENEHLYLQATEEFESDDIDEALWAKALTVARGDTNAALYEYVEMRVHQLENDQAEIPQTCDLESVHEPSEPIKNPSYNEGWVSQLREGRFGLARTYWLYGMVFGNLAALIPYFFVLENQSLAAQLSIIALVIGMAVVLLGIWNAASRYEGSKVWAVLAKIAAVFGWVNICAAALGVFAL